MEKKLKKQQDMYDKTWATGLQAGKEHRSNLNVNLDFLDQINLFHPNHRILEVGCGIGTIVNQLSQKGFNAIGSDISNQAIQYGQKKYPNINLEVSSAEKLPYPNKSFDYVISFDLLEHIRYVDQHITEVSRVLKDHGCYLFQTPNKFSNVIFETLKTHNLQWRKYHPSLHSPRQLKQRFKKHNFDIQFVKMNTINEFTLKKIKRLGPIASLAGFCDSRWLPLCLQTNLYVIAKKK